MATITRWVVIAALACAACKKDAASGDLFGAGATGAGSADGDGNAGSNDDRAGSAAVAAVDPWNRLPASADNDLGATCGPKLNQIDPWAGSPKLEAKVDVAKIEKPVADKVEIRTLGGAAATGFTVTYNPSPNANHQQYRELFVGNRLFEQVAEQLNHTIRLPHKIEINTVTCNTINAFYDPRTRRIIMCYELLDYFVSMFKETAASEAELGNAVMGATMFGFFHELGHGLIDVLDLPAVGREEDSVDQLATLTLIAGGEKGVAMALAGAYWFRLQAKGSGNKTPFWDEHAFDEQRFYNITCLIFGSDPGKHGDLVRSGTLPWNRAQRCPDEYTKLKKSWEKLLQPHLTTAGATNVAYAPSVPATEAPRSTPPEVTRVADPPEEPEAPTTPARAIPCEAIAQKAAELIAAEAEQRARALPPGEVEALRVRLETQLPAVMQALLAQCVRENWSDASRKCVLDARTLAQAEKCK